MDGSFAPQGWDALIPPGLRQQILARCEASGLPPIVATRRLMGNVIAAGVCLPDESGEGELVALATVPALRRRGMATALLVELREAARQQGLHGLTASWTGSREDPGDVGRLLRHAGWAPATEAGISMTLGAVWGADFLLGLAGRLPACPLAFVPWGDISAEQREGLRRALQSHPLPAPGLDPFAGEQTADAEISFALVSTEGEVRGWHLARWSDTGSAWVIVSYGLPDVLGGACFLRLWAQFFQRAALRGPEATCSWDTHFSLQRMSRFLLRRENDARPVTKARWTSSLALGGTGRPT